jgi:hypothetical protein
MQFVHTSSQLFSLVLRRSLKRPRVLLLSSPGGPQAPGSLVRWQPGLVVQWLSFQLRGRARFGCLVAGLGLRPPGGLVRSSGFHPLMLGVSAVMASRLRLAVACKPSGVLVIYTGTPDLISVFHP